MDDVEPDEPERPHWSRWLGWAVVGAGAAAGLWLAALPIDLVVPEPPPQRARTLEPPPATPAPGEPESGAGVEPPAPAQPATPLPPEREAIDPPAAPPATEWAETMPLPEDETPAQAALRERLERQLAMNDLAGVQIEIAGDRVITRGALRHPADRQRVALLIRSLAPGFVHEDRVEVAGAR